MRKRKRFEWPRDRTGGDPALVQNVLIWEVYERLLTVDDRPVDDFYFSRSNLYVSAVRWFSAREVAMRGTHRGPDDVLLLQREVLFWQPDYTRAVWMAGAPTAMPDAVLAHAQPQAQFAVVDLGVFRVQVNRAPPFASRFSVPPERASVIELKPRDY